MIKSIGARITLYMLLFSLVIIGIIAVSVKFILPDYYLNHQLGHIESVKTAIYDQYDTTDPEAVIPLLEELKDNVGGELYYFSATMGNSLEQGRGQGRNAYKNSNSESFKADGDVTTYSYVNKIGLDIFVIGIALEEEYLVYEVSLQALDGAVNEILGFFWLLLIAVLILAVVLSIVLSRNIAKPIRSLNQLAKAMKGKKISAVMVTENQDEISELNTSLNELYEELLFSIYQLETELQRERNAENLKKRFLAQATHELKTPIAVIRGYAEILYDGIYKNEDERDRYLKNIYDETEAISHLILDVLDYTKMETGNYTLNKKEVMAAGYFDEAINRYKEYIQQGGKEARIHIDLPMNQKVLLDTERMDQVIRNLISNSVEHSHQWVQISVDSPGEKIRIAVTNDGEAIEDKDMPYLFDSFYKKEGKQKGTGLGLAIVKEIITLHGGDCRAENLERGVRFTVAV